MQAIFLDNEEAIKAFRKTISEARFSRYLKMADGDAEHALELYHWNAKLSQSLYLPLQMWEISLRNKLNNFLIWKSNSKWPYDSRVVRNLKSNEVRRLQATISREAQRRKVGIVPTDAIVADLSAGFWVALLTKGYDVPFAWRYNLARIFPNDPSPDRQAISSSCDQLLDLRNRIAHHEPILHLPLADLRSSAEGLISAMCSSALQYSNSACTFANVWAARPLLNAELLPTVTE